VALLAQVRRAGFPFPKTLQLFHPLLILGLAAMTKFRREIIDLRLLVDGRSLWQPRSPVRNGDLVLHHLLQPFLFVREAISDVFDGA